MPVKLTIETASTTEQKWNNQQEFPPRKEQWNNLQFPRRRKNKSHIICRMHEFILCELATFLCTSISFKNFIFTSISSMKASLF